MLVHARRDERVLDTARGRAQGESFGWEHGTRVPNNRLLSTMRGRASARAEGKKGARVECGRELTGMRGGLSRCGWRRGRREAAPAPHPTPESPPPSPSPRFARSARLGSARSSLACQSVSLASSSSSPPRRPHPPPRPPYMSRPSLCAVHERDAHDGAAQAGRGGRVLVHAARRGRRPRDQGRGEGDRDQGAARRRRAAPARAQGRQARGPAHDRVALAPAAGGSYAVFPCLPSG